MNKNNAAQFLPLVQALADGKVIQVRHSDKSDWADCLNPHFDGVSDYRVKPEPREFVGHIHTTTRAHSGAYRLIEIKIDGSEGDLPDMRKPFRLIEILD